MLYARTVSKMAIDPLKSESDRNRKAILLAVVPMLAQLPSWVESKTYLEFGDDEVRNCNYCHTMCEYAYFKLLQFNTRGLELCGNCLDKHKTMKASPWALYVREGLIRFLVSLNDIVDSEPTSAVPVGFKSPSSGAQSPIATSVPSTPNSGSSALGLEQHSERLLELVQVSISEPVLPTSEPLLVTPASDKATVPHGPHGQCFPHPLQILH